MKRLNPIPRLLALLSEFASKALIPFLSLLFFYAFISVFYIDVIEDYIGMSFVYTILGIPMSYFLSYIGHWLVMKLNYKLTSKDVYKATFKTANIFFAILFVILTVFVVTIFFEWVSGGERILDNANGNYVYNYNYNYDYALIVLVLGWFIIYFFLVHFGISMLDNVGVKGKTSIINKVFQV